MMISYEVTVEVEAEILSDFDAYMTTKHLPDVMATGCFLAARYYADSSRRRTVYEAADQETLDRYLGVEAARLRDDFAKHFPSGVKVSRAFWNLKMTVAASS